MKKFFAVVVLLTTLFISTAYADDGFTPTKAPAEINHPDSIYYDTHIDFYNMTSTDNTPADLLPR